MYCYDPNGSKRHTETSVIPHYQMLKLGFSQFDDLITYQGDIAIIVSFNQNLEHLSLEAYTTIPSSNISNPLVPVYLSACDPFHQIVSILRLKNALATQKKKKRQKSKKKEHFTLAHRSLWSLHRVYMESTRSLLGVYID